MNKSIIPERRKIINNSGEVESKKSKMEEDDSDVSCYIFFKTLLYHKTNFFKHSTFTRELPVFFNSLHSHLCSLMNVYF